MKVFENENVLFLLLEVGKYFNIVLKYTDCIIIYALVFTWHVMKKIQQIDYEYVSLWVYL